MNAVTSDPFVDGLRDDMSSYVNSGTYIASRASLPECSAAWRRLRDIDGRGSLWKRIESEINPMRDQVKLDEVGER